MHELNPYWKVALSIIIAAFLLGFIACTDPPPPPYYTKNMVVHIEDGSNNADFIRRIKNSVDSTNLLSKELLIDSVIQINLVDIKGYNSSDFPQESSRHFPKNNDTIHVFIPASSLNKNYYDLNHHFIQISRYHGSRPRFLLHEIVHHHLQSNKHYSEDSIQYCFNLMREEPSFIAHQLTVRQVNELRHSVGLGPITSPTNFLPYPDVFMDKLKAHLGCQKNQNCANQQSISNFNQLDTEQKQLLTLLKKNDYCYINGRMSLAAVQNIGTPEIWHEMKNIITEGYHFDRLEQELIEYWNHRLPSLNLESHFDLGQINDRWNVVIDSLPLADSIVLRF